MGHQTMNVNVSVKMDKNSVLGGAIVALSIASIICFCSNQKTKRLELKQKSQKELYESSRNIRA